MKKLNYFFVFLFFIISMMIFLPQKNIFYIAEKFLAKNQTYISNEIIEQKLFGVDIKNMEIIFEDINIGNIQNIQMNFLGFHNKIVINKMVVKAGNFTFIPKNIDIVEATHSILSPLKILLYSQNDLGIINGFISLNDQKIFLELRPSKDAKVKYANVLKVFTAQKEGLYTYEKNIKLY